MSTPERTAAPGRTVRVRTEVAALARTFDYAVPARWTDDQVVVGSRVRVPLHGRTVRGWVVDDHLEAPSDLDLLPVKSWLGWGPPAAVVDLAAWAAWRWAGPVSFFLNAASPPALVRELPRPTGFEAPGPDVDHDGGARDADSVALAARVWSSADRQSATIVRFPPATDLIHLVLAAVSDAEVAAHPGQLLVLVPSTGWAERLTERLRRRGVPATTAWDEARAGWPVVVGTRTGAWAPLPALAAALVLDAHDPSYREESAPAYSAVDVVVERGRREAAPCLLVSPVPPVTLPAVTVLTEPAAGERSGWAFLERVDRRGADPRTGLFSHEFVNLARAVLGHTDRPATPGPTATAETPPPLVCVYNRTGGASLLACAKCGELARCARCGAAARRERQDHTLRCPRCGDVRPEVCAACGGLRIRTVRPGVSRLREELEALLGVPVGEVAGPRGRGATGAEAASTEAAANARVLVGTEAVLHRVRRATAVAFLDIDLHLMSSRLSATEETLGLLVRASRLVGARGTGPPWARVQVQTRVPDHPVLLAAGRGDPTAVLAAELEARRAATLPPFAAMALVSGKLAPSYGEALEASLAPAGPVALSPLAPERFLLHAPDHETLCDLLAGTPRPAGRGLRVEVDPADL